jgi:hypothetical protein
MADAKTPALQEWRAGASRRGIPCEGSISWHLINVRGNRCFSLTGKSVCLENFAAPVNGRVALCVCLCAVTDRGWPYDFHDPSSAALASAWTVNSSRLFSANFFAISGITPNLRLEMVKVAASTHSPDRCSKNPRALQRRSRGQGFPPRAVEGAFEMRAVQDGSLRGMRVRDLNQHQLR